MGNLVTAGLTVGVGSALAPSGLMVGVRVHAAKLGELEEVPDMGPAARSCADQRWTLAPIGGQI